MGIPSPVGSGENRVLSTPFVMERWEIKDLLLDPKDTETCLRDVDE